VSNLTAPAPSVKGERALTLQGDLLTLKIPGRRKGTVDVFVYRIHRISGTVAGAGFRLLRIETPRPDDDAGVYDVFLPEPNGQHPHPLPSCDCKGFLRWGHCKHIDATIALVSRNLI
jgi:hypothetical protein